MQGKSAEGKLWKDDLKKLKDKPAEQPSEYTSASLVLILKLSLHTSQAFNFRYSTTSMVIVLFSKKVTMLTY